jgi:hypothetical protein
LLVAAAAAIEWVHESIKTVFCATQKSESTIKSIHTASEQARAKAEHSNECRENIEKVYGGGGVSEGEITIVRADYV